MAGIPARVVTGYLATQDLQTRAHRRGLQVLWQTIEELQQYAPSQLVLVTTAHRHSWTQIYMPAYGWVDFETTAFAIPPMGGGDPNNMNVVIPILQEGEQPAPQFQFPWLLVGRVLGIFVLFGILGAYLLRYGREAYLLLLAKSKNTRGLRALQAALLMRLAAEGYPVKHPAETIQEYSDEHPELSRFAALYTRLRYREKSRPQERAESWKDLRVSYRSVLDENRKSGIVNSVKRAFSLKGLYYL
jgi:hypothetical protein